MKRMIKASYGDSIKTRDELLELVLDSLSAEQVVRELVGWMSSDEAAHALEDIAISYDLLSDFSDTYEEFEEWYSGLSASDKYEVDAIASDIGIADGYNRYADITEEQFHRLVDILEFKKG